MISCPGRGDYQGRIAIAMGSCFLWTLNLRASPVVSFSHLQDPSSPFFPHTEISGPLLCQAFLFMDRLTLCPLLQPPAVPSSPTLTVWVQDLLPVSDLIKRMGISYSSAQGVLWMTAGPWKRQRKAKIRNCCGWSHTHAQPRHSSHAKWELPFPA